MRGFVWVELELIPIRKRAWNWSESPGIGIGAWTKDSDAVTDHQPPTRQPDRAGDNRTESNRLTITGIGESVA
jgi:hypothetical protein